VNWWPKRPLSRLHHGDDKSIITLSDVIAAMAPPAPRWSLTEHLLQTSHSEYKVATQHPFLLAAAEGRLPKHVLGRWLAHDRLYIHSYIRAVGKMLHALHLPEAVPAPDAPEPRLVDWLVDALVAVRKEERLFLDVADRYNLPGLGPVDAAATTAATGSSSGLAMINDVFESIPAASDSGSIETATAVAAAAAAGRPALVPLPWLEGAVVFWGTERCYLDAWSWARCKQALGGGWFGGGGSGRDDADGGALRREFIPAWSSAEFAGFVARLGGLIDGAVEQALERAGDDGEALKREILDRVEGKWTSLLAAEAAFWPDVE